MHNVLDQITLLMCNTYSGVHLDICTACAHWTIFNTTCNMVSALLCILHIMQHATCFLMLCSAAIALHGCLCSATDHTDVCTPVSGADGVLRPSLLGRQDNDIANVSISVSMLLLNVIRLPQHRHYDDMMWWRNPCAGHHKCFRLLARRLP